jgi:hypothetical protein
LKVETVAKSSTPGKGEFTHLAGEFYVLSCLNRNHIWNLLTLGNYKAIDIIAVLNDEKKTIDVKAVDKDPVFLGDPKELYQDKNHFYVVVYFGHSPKDNSYSNINVAPEVYIVPSRRFCELANAKKTYMTVRMKNIQEYKVTPERGMSFLLSNDGERENGMVRKS